MEVGRTSLSLRSQPAGLCFDLRLALAALALGALSGCQGFNMSSPQLRVVDASPDAGILDAYANSNGLAYNLEFGTVTSYVAMAPGTYALSVDHAGTRQTLVTGNQTLVAGRQYTEIVGNVAAGLQETVLQDQTSAAPAGQISVRFLQQATRSGAVDVYLVPRGAHMVSLTPVATNLSFGANSGYLNVPAATYAVVVVPTGTTLVSSTVTLLSGSQVEYTAGSAHTVVLIDEETVGLQTTSATAPLTRGVHAIIANDFDAQ